MTKNVKVKLFSFFTLLQYQVWVMIVSRCIMVEIEMGHTQMSGGKRSVILTSVHSLW
jgi:hypothetical protein